MRKTNKIALILIFQALFCLQLSAQEEWLVPASESERLSIQLFDEDIQQEGKQIYSTSCISCHGNPTQENYTRMAPPPGDVSSELFQTQSDGDLLYKIKKGRGSMPSFENSFSENELWSLVAYMRGFHEGYIQERPNMEGIEIPVLVLGISYDENVDKLVVKVTNEEQESMDGVSVKGFIKGMFGNFMLGKTQTNELGIAYFDIDSKIPGDKDGFITVIVKASKGYGAAKTEERVQAAAPTVNVSAIAGRHLWSTAKKAPWWQIIAFNLMGVGVWLVILYILIGLRKIKKLQ